MPASMVLPGPNASQPDSIIARTLLCRALVRSGAMMAMWAVTSPPRGDMSELAHIDVLGSSGLVLRGASCVHVVRDV
jgi:hypothetical protein